MSHLKKVKYNWQHVKTHWEEVVFRLCDEVTPHDVLNEVANYIQIVVLECEKLKLNAAKFSEALQLVKQALDKINPTDEV